MTVSKYTGTDNPFATGRRKAAIGDENPLFAPFFESYESGDVLHVDTDDAAATIKTLRKIAAENGLGVRVKEVEGGVVFQGKAKRVRHSADE